jgi:hypothetical protein
MYLKPRASALPPRLSALREGAADGPSRLVRLDFDEKAGFLIDQAPYAGRRKPFARMNHHRCSLTV